MKKIICITAFVAGMALQHQALAEVYATYDGDPTPCIDTRERPIDEQNWLKGELLHKSSVNSSMFDSPSKCAGGPPSSSSKCDHWLVGINWAERNGVRIKMTAYGSFDACKKYAASRKEKSELMSRTYPAINNKIQKPKVTYLSGADIRGVHVALAREKCSEQPPDDVSGRSRDFRVAEVIDDQGVSSKWCWARSKQNAVKLTAICPIDKVSGRLNDDDGCMIEQKSDFIMQQ